MSSSAQGAGGIMICRAAPLAYLAATNACAVLRLMTMSDRDKDIEILALRHQLLVLQRQVGKPAFTDTDRAILAGLLHHLAPADNPIHARQRSHGRPSLVLP
jgi:hypothetical protein